MTTPTLHRRRALLALGGLAGAWAVPTVVGAQGAVLAWVPQGLTMDQARTLAAACERIMPATATPGAGALGVPQFVDRAIATWCEPADAERLRAGLVGLDADARAKFGRGFGDLAAGDQDQLLSAAEVQARRGPHFFPLLVQLTTTGYFTSERGATEVLRYDPIPGEFRPCVPIKELGRAPAI